MLCPFSMTARRRTVRAIPLKSSLSRFYSGSPEASSSSLPILHIPKSSIFALGDPNTAEPVLRDVSWTIQPHEAWAVLSFGYSKKTLFDALTGHRRIHPPPPKGLFPFLGLRDPTRHVGLVGFGHNSGARTGFQDYTARYGAVRDEDKRTLRETYFPETAKPFDTLAMPDLYTPAQIDINSTSDKAREKQELFDKLMTQLNLTELLDLPVIALSNGQTRRARIARALLQQPSVLLLDEPLSELSQAPRMEASD